MDKGVGIPEEQIPLLTEPFYTLDKARTRKHGGAGLGLALCSEIAQAHGSQLRIVSKPGAGTSVSVTLPKAGTNAGVAPSKAGTKADTKAGAKAGSKVDTKAGAKAGTRG
jgi:signal transduction histidine kinase